MKLVTIELNGANAKVTYDHCEQWIDENGIKWSADSRGREAKFIRKEGQWKLAKRKPIEPGELKRDQNC